MDKKGIELLKQVSTDKNFTHYLDVLSKYSNLSEEVTSFLEEYCNKHSGLEDSFYIISDNSLDDVVTVYSNKGKYRLAISGVKEWEDSSSDDFCNSKMWKGFIEELSNNTDKKVINKGIRFCNHNFKDIIIKRRKGQNPFEYISTISFLNFRKGRFIHQFKEYTKTYKNLIVIFYGIDNDVIFDMI